MKDKYIFIANHAPVPELAERYELVTPSFAGWDKIPKTRVKDYLAPLLAECERLIAAGDVAGVIVTGEPRATFAVVEALSPIAPCYSTYSERRSIDVPNEDGSVTKTSVFKFDCLAPYETGLGLESEPR